MSFSRYELKSKVTFFKSPLSFIKTLVSNGLDKDYLEILYAGSDKIYIPVEKIDLLFKY